MWQCGAEMDLAGIDASRDRYDLSAGESDSSVAARAVGNDFAAAVVPLTVKPSPQPSVDQLLAEAGLDLSLLDSGLAQAVRQRVAIVDGKLDLTGLYFNGIGDDLSVRVQGAINGLNNWTAGIDTVQFGESFDRPYSVAEMATNAGGHGVLSSAATDASALPALNTLAGLLRHMPEPPRGLTAAQAGTFRQLVSQTGDGHWSRMPTEQLARMLDALRPKADGSLDLAAAFGGRMGFDPGPPSDAYARQMESTLR